MPIHDPDFQGKWIGQFPRVAERAARQIEVDEPDVAILLSQNISFFLLLIDNDFFFPIPVVMVADMGCVDIVSEFVILQE